jgi:hypothetical protein
MCWSTKLNNQNITRKYKLYSIIFMNSILFNIVDYLNILFSFILFTEVKTFKLLAVITFIALNKYFNFNYLFIIFYFKPIL